jgi:hypothetical protein
LIKPPKPKKQPICKWCKETFTRSSSLQKVCTWTCGLKLAESERVKKEQKSFKAETAVMKKAIKDKDRAYWIKKAQQLCNKYVRIRDKDLPCISCGRNHAGQYHAGHFRSVGACSALRFDDRQIRKQCAPCNSHLSGNIINYRPALIKILGLESVVEIENTNAVRRWSIDELKGVCIKYTKLIKEIE